MKKDRKGKKKMLESQKIGREERTNRMIREVVRNYHCSAQRNGSGIGCHVAVWEGRMEPAAVLRAFAMLQVDTMQHELKHEQLATCSSGVLMLE